MSSHWQARQAPHCRCTSICYSGPKSNPRSLASNNNNNNKYKNNNSNDSTSIPAPKKWISCAPEAAPGRTRFAANNNNYNKHNSNNNNNNNNANNNNPSVRHGSWRYHACWSVMVFFLVKETASG
ncbi:unnamed protein product [Polarella glacialis]|uniref:Uncharacterized protein n=1 Tax=Polarella glacialis TaxID=89957 RepID=A0A813EYJ3_POLGL|nr:unnamed protein product [Polarella glacialis]